MENILVSAYINIEKYEYKERQYNENIIENGNKLIDLPIYKIIFIDKDYIHKFNNNKYTKIIPIYLEELNIYGYYKYFYDNRYNILSINKVKDTLLFHIIQYAKSEFLLRAIDYYDHTSIFVWIDIGIYKVFDGYEQFYSSIMNINKLIYKIIPNRIILPGCWELENIDVKDDKILWYFCGGFLIIPKYLIYLFNSLILDELLLIIINNKKIIYEVNIWYNIWKKYNYLFYWYKANHNHTMFKFSII